MKRVGFFRLGAVLLAIAGALLLIPLANRVGNSTGKHSGDHPNDTADCPMGQPADCRAAVAHALGVPAATVPDIATPKGLAYRRGEILTSDKKTTAVFTFGASDDTFALKVFFAHGVFPPHRDQKTDVTPRGREFKIARGSQGVIGLTYDHDGFRYVVTTMTTAMDKQPGVMAASESLIDSIGGTSPS